MLANKFIKMTIYSLMFIKSEVVIFVIYILYIGDDYLMKKFFVNFFKILLFFSLWAISLNFLDVESSNPVWWRFWAEMTPFFL